MITEFEALFGMNEKSVKRNCVLMPLLPKGLPAQFGIQRFSKGRLYQTANTDSFTLVNTRIGPAFAGDAVLYLKETACQNVILFGSCGLVEEKKGFSIGSLVCPAQCYAYESFSAMLLAQGMLSQAFYPDEALVNALLKSGPEVQSVSCTTLGSLKLEQDMAGYFTQHHIDVVDMECSAFFAASRYCGLKAAALLYVTDIINKKPFYRKLAPADASRLAAQMESAATLVSDSFRLL